MVLFLQILQKVRYFNHNWLRPLSLSTLPSPLSQQTLGSAGVGESMAIWGICLREFELGTFSLGLVG
jgi:hypothetical protein